MDAKTIFAGAIVLFRFFVLDSSTPLCWQKTKKSLRSTRGACLGILETNFFLKTNSVGTTNPFLRFWGI